VKNLALTHKIGERVGLLAAVLNREPFNEIERELPFAVLMFTLMAASGISLYESWKRMQKVHLLPNFKEEANDVVRQVEVLGRDPLTVMYKKSEKTTSKLYRDFLGGYVSAVKSGANVVNFLKSKLRSIFERQNAAAIRSIERLGTLVEAYAVMLIVTLCCYILYVVMSSSAFTKMMAMGEGTGDSTLIAYLFIFVGIPLLSIVFMAVANMARRSNLLNLKKVYLQALIGGIIALAIFSCFVFIPQLQPTTNNIGLPTLATICLLIISIPPAILYRKIARINYAAEEAMPSFIRDVTEARKIGLSPEKSIVHASKRSGYGRFAEVLQLVRGQIEWGVSLRKIFDNIRKKIQSWPVLVHFLVLVQAIEVGGGSTVALDILSEYSEKDREIESNKRSMLKPYVILSFVWSVLIALTTTIVAMTIGILSQMSTSEMTMPSLAPLQHHVMILSVGIIIQCWLSGFFIGKISEGTFAAGFKYSAALSVTALISLLMSQNFFAGLWSMAPKG
jgi:flagellar protein FlaJ